MAPRTDRTTRISFAVASPVTTNHAVKGYVFVNLTRAGNLRDCSTHRRLQDAATQEAPPSAQQSPAGSSRQLQQVASSSGQLAAGEKMAPTPRPSTGALPPDFISQNVFID